MGRSFSIPSRGRSLERMLHVRHSWLYQSPVFANSGSSFRNHIRVGQWLSIFSTRGSCECQLLSIAYFRAIIPEAAVVPLCIVLHHSGSLAGEAGFHFGELHDQFGCMQTFQFVISISCLGVLVLLRDSGAVVSEPYV